MEPTLTKKRVHPIVRLDYVVRVLGCPIPALIVASSRLSAAEPMPLGLWIGLALYGLIWPHFAFVFAKRGADSRSRELRSLVFDAAVAGAAIALASFRTLPTIALATGYASMLASVGGVSLLAIGLPALVGSALLAGALFTGFAVETDASLLSTALSAMLLFSFQVLLGLQTYRTARGFVESRRRIAEQADEIQLRNHELIQAREEALQAAKAKAAFLAIMSHEIRTPLNGVLGMTRLLTETSLNTEQREFVHTIQVSGNTLLTVINEILDYSRIESGRMELEEEPLSVAEVVEESLEIVAERAREKGLELVSEVSPEVPQMIFGDVTRLRQIVTNLVGNAVKFTEKGEVLVKLSRSRAETEEAPAEIAIEVKDTGIGIPEDRIPMLFSPFSQADASTTRKYGGTGLGLAISKRLTELMDGRISVESEVGKGSSFRLTIEARSAPDSQPRPAPEPTNLSGKRILVVDDNATNRRVLCSQLESWGFKALSTEGAIQALGALGQEIDFDLAILDLHMPDVDGMTLARQIRELSRHRDLPLILLSSSLVLNEDDPERLFTARVMKPARQSRLYDAIMEAFGTAVSTRAMDEMATGPNRIADRAPLRILVVDDNEINRNVASLVFRRFGYEVDFAVNGQEAVEEVTHHALSAEHDDSYDLVFMDVHMPEMDGLEATQAIRQHAVERPEKHWPRVVAMTADAMQGDRQNCLDAGMDDYLTKPLDFEAVQGVIEQTAEICSAASRPLVSGASSVEVGPPSSELSSPDPGPVTVMEWSRLEELKSIDTPDGALVNGIIAAFVEQTPSKLAELRSSAVEKNSQSLREAAHGLKGAATNIGAVAVADCATLLEQAGRSGSLEGVDTMLDNLSSVLIKTLAELHPRAEQGSKSL